MDPGVQAGRFPQSGGFVQQMGQLNNGAMQQTGQLGMGATRITQQGMTQVGQFGRDGLAYAGQGVDSLGQAGSFGQNTVSQAGQLSQNAMGQAGQLGQNAMSQAGQLGQNAVSYMREDQFGSDTLGQAPSMAQNPDRASGLTDPAQVSYSQEAGAAESYAGATGGAWPEPPTAPVEPQPVTNTSPVRTQAPPVPWTAPKRGDTTDLGSQSRMYYIELLQFFRTQPARHSLLTPSRTSAREKLTRLNKQQFSELSTDVHDELQRRQDVQQLLPHLPGRDDFHPKRNQARQKLSTLPKSRFRDLASDVFFELERRYPELPAELRSESLEYLMGGREAQEGSNVPPVPNDSMSSVLPTSEAPPTEPQAAVPERSSGTERPVSATLAQRQLAEVMADAQQLTSSQVYVPPRSTAVEEDPNAGEIHEAEPVPVPSRAPLDPAPLAPPIATERMSGPPPVAEALMEPGPVPTASAPAPVAPVPAAPVPAAPRVTSAELKAYEEQVAELQQRVRTLEAQEMTLRSEGDRSQQQLEELQTRNVALTNRIAQLEQEMEGHVQQTRALQTEGAQYRSALDDKHAELLQHRADLDDLRRQYNDLHLQHASRAPDAEAEAQWKREIDLMQRNTAEHQRMVQELRDEVASLLDELRRLSARNDAMTADKESDVAIIRDLHQQMSTYKRRFEQAKAELRMMQTTTQLWAQPQAEEWKHMSDRGAIADTNLQAFQSSIDELLSAARSPTPSNVLIAMKTVVLSTTLLTDDVAKFEAQPENMDTLNAQQREDVHSLKLSLSEALSNLMNACRQYASSQGLSPVSLVDAAATHVATAVVELIKLLKLRHVSKPAEDDTSLDTPSDTPGAPSGLKPLHMRGAASPPNVLPRTVPRAVASSSSLRSLSYSHSNLESRMLGMDKQGLSSSPSRSVAVPTNAAVPPVQSATTTRELPSIPVAQNAASLHGPPDESMPDSLLSLPPVSNAAPADAPSVGAYGNNVAVPADGLASVHEEDTDNWAELRNYIEVQTEAIVHSIQSLLSALREGAQGVQLNENLTQITTIVSSIVAISRDHLPQVSARHPSMATEAERIFADLTENCDRLSDMQSNETFDRSAKSVMASASYGVAKGLKSLNELLNASDEAL